MDSEASVVPVVVPVDPPTVSQLPPEVVEGAALNVAADPLLVVTMTPWAKGAVPPAVAVNVRPVVVDALRLSVGRVGGGGVVTLAVTETVWAPLEALPVAGVMTTLPLQVPAGRLDAPTTSTVTDVGVLAPGGTALNQLPQVVVEKLVVYAIGAPLLVTEIVPDVGVTVPLLTLRVSEAGLTVMVGVGGGVATAGVIT
jgi:hypothetical protein